MPAALVTGASRGIGQAVAVALAARGYDVCITARSVDALAASERAIANTAAPGVKIFKVAMDVTDAEGCRGCVPAALKGLRTSCLDVVVHAAIYQGPALDQLVSELTSEELQRAMGSFTSAFIIFQAALPVMAPQGSMVLIVSSASHMRPTRPVTKGGWSLGYVAAKTAASKILPLLKIEAGSSSSLRFFNVEPGLVITEHMKQTGKAEEMRKWGDIPPQVCGQVVAHLTTLPPDSSLLRKVNGSAFVYAPKLAFDLGMKIEGFHYDASKAEGIEGKL